MTMISNFLMIQLYALQYWGYRAALRPVTEPQNRP